MNVRLFADCIVIGHNGWSKFIAVLLRNEKKVGTERLGQQKKNVTGSGDYPALRWADEKCRQNATQCSAENLRSALCPALFKIRFPLITYEEFTQNIVPSGVLTPEESVGICQFHLPGLLSPVAFPSHARIFRVE
ncbi:hypothetical protein niasHT_030330 [Heterodera trifolii]|uniref:Uncharacterized protein n=1 Tax=Heterodera trifolii TaxID=157864 RepID=A0ABD2KRW9_9BILA